MDVVNPTDRLFIFLGCMGFCHSTGSDLLFLILVSTISSLHYFISIGFWKWLHRNRSDSAYFPRLSKLHLGTKIVGYQHYRLHNISILFKKSLDLQKLLFYSLFEQFVKRICRIDGAVLKIKVKGFDEVV